MSNSMENITRCTVMTTMFGHGGVVSYWKDVINAVNDKASWNIFVNEVPGVDLDPFKRSNVSVIPGLKWRNPLVSSKNLISNILTFKPQCLIFNGTLAMLRVFPALIYLRFFCPWLKIKCVFHNGAIYQNFFKDNVNRVVVSCLAFFCHENIFVSEYAQSFWLCQGTVSSRPFLINPRALSPSALVPTVGFLGRISHEKDPELFLKTMTQVKKNIDVNINVAGEGPLKAELEKNYPFVNWRGWIDPNSWFKEIDLLITSSKTEGWPIAIAEALEAGVPVIGINVGGVGEILKGVPDEWLKKTRDEFELSEMVTKFCQNYRENTRTYFEALRPPKISLSEWALKLISHNP